MINFTESVVGRGLQAFVDGVADMVNVVSDFVDIPMSEKLDEERVALNRMVFQLTEANIKEEDRNKLIIKINKQYPAFLKNIDTEKTSTKQLKDRLREYNSQLIDKIVLQKEEEKLNKISNEAADARANQIRRENELLDELIKASEEHDVALLDGATVSENYAHIKEVLTSRLTGFHAALDPAKKSLEGLNGFVIRASFANQELKNHTEELNTATQDRDALAKRLGISLEEVIELEEEETEVIRGNTYATTENTKAKKEQYDVEADLIELIINRGVSTEEEQVRVQEYLNKLREKEILLQLESLDETVGSFAIKKALLLELEALRKGVDEDDEKRKEESFQADIVRSIISGQSAEEAVKNAVKAQIMKAVSALIASIFENVPFPYSLILAAGANMMVAKIVDTQLDEFADGGMVQGKSHAQGGEKFAIGGRVVELEGGEAVINKRSTAMFRGQLSAMNSAGGGVRFADGGLLNSPAFSQQQFNALGQNNMASAMSGSRKVVVVEADITSTQDAVSVLQAQATI
jgi:hypothetical protein